MELDYIVKTYTYSEISGRYITGKSIAGFIGNLKYNFKVSVEGKSVLGKEIKSVTWGTGPVKVLMWSQMHGNESTTTKAVIDLLNYLSDDNQEKVLKWRDNFTIKIIPILNPDGAELYTRANANGVDLNRDSIDLSEPESLVLRKNIEEFSPDYAFNLHDQRTIFGVGQSDKPATISFLSPAYNVERDVNPNREVAMKLIAFVKDNLEKDLPGQVGRFDDSFNINCIGDYCQTLNIPTVLFEAGHYQEDYEREQTRKYVFKSLLYILEGIETEAYVKYATGDYYHIPENEKSFCDVALTNVVFVDSGESYIVNIQFLEELKEEKVKFCPIVVDINKKQSKFVHLSINKVFYFKKSSDFMIEMLNENLSDVVNIEDVEVKKLLKK